MAIIKKRELTYLILSLYPFINILFCYLFKGDKMNTVSLTFCLFIILLNYGIPKRIPKTDIIIIGIISVAVSLSFFREEEFSNKVVSLLYAVTTMFFVMCYRRKIDFEDLKNRLINRPFAFFVGQIAFLALLFIHFMQNGLTYGWNTILLQGPYNYPHTLAYILLFMLCGNLYLILKKIETKPVIFAGIEVILIILTAVRSVCVSLAITALFVLRFYFTTKNLKNAALIIILGIVSVCVAFKYGLFESFIAKTNLSVEGGYGISNNRGNTFISSLSTFEKYGVFPFNIIFGVGLESLIKNNLQLLGSSIHAHNDFIDIFISYGIFNLLVYLFCFIKVGGINTNTFWFILTIGVLIFFNGLFTYIDCIPLMVWAILCFNYSKNEKVRRK